MFILPLTFNFSIKKNITSLPNIVFVLQSYLHSGFYQYCCSAQDLICPRDRDTCSTASEVPQADNTLKMSCGSYATRRRESQVHPRATSQLRGEDSESLLILQSATTRLLSNSYWAQLNSKISGS